jgi:EpsI family protein
MSVQTLRQWVTPPVLPRRRFWVAVCIMLLALVVGWVSQPHRMWSEAMGNPTYRATLPARFGDWVRTDVGVAAVVDPVQSEMLARIYSETVSATYVNQRSGRLMMLSIAYGRNQSSDTQLHTPEMCYGSQGFKVEDGHVVRLVTPWGRLPVRQVPTRMGERTEPLSYFIRNGEYVTTEGSLQRNLARMSLALRGYIGDGLLVRVSEVTNRQEAFDLQARFIAAYLAALTPAQRELYIGHRLQVGQGQP